MFKTILLPTDGSALSARAMPYALDLARHATARLVLVRAYLPSGDSLSLRLREPGKSETQREEIDQQQTEAEFQAQVAALRPSGSVVASRFVNGRAADVILNTASEEQADLVVMSTHGRGGIGRWLYGSVADEVLRRISIPVMLISSACQGSWAGHRPRRILVPLDGSRRAAEVIQPAAELAEALGGAEIVLLAVVEPHVNVYPDAEVQELGDPIRETDEASEYLKSMLSDVRSVAPGSVTYRVEYGDAALTIASLARDANVDVIAMATHGRGGVARLVLGGIASRTLQLASVPVLVYRPVAVREAVLDRGAERAVTPASA